MNKIIVLRHSECYANESVKKDPAGWYKYSEELTKPGKKLAKRTGRLLKKYDIGRIYSSPEKRALETAKIIGEILNKEITIVDNLKEHIISKKILSSEELNDLRKSWENNSDKAFHNGESLQKLQDRAIKTINKIIENNNSSLVITHEGFMQTLCAKYLHNSPFNFRLNLKINHASGFIVEFNKKIIHRFYGLRNKNQFLDFMNYRPTIVGIVRKDENYIIINKKMHSEDTWTFVQGKIEKNETEEQALKRECFEELNINISNIKKIPLNRMFDWPGEWIGHQGYRGINFNFYQCETNDEIKIDDKEIRSFEKVTKAQLLNKIDFRFKYGYGSKIKKYL